MISNQQSLSLSPFMAIYDMVVPKDNMLRKINEIVDFSFVQPSKIARNLNGKQNLVIKLKQKTVS